MSIYNEWLNQLQDNDKQLAAYSKNDHTVVIAGPGSGKTRVLALRVSDLLKNQIAPPQGIVCLTYTRVMARELENRLIALGISDRPNVVINTVHGFCLGQVISQFADLYNLDIPRPIRIVPQSIQVSCLEKAQKELAIAVDRDDFNKYRRQRIDLPPEQWPNHQEIQIVIDLYEKFLFEQGYVDFDVIVRYALYLISGSDFVRKSLEAKFPWIAVDEYQDLGYPLFRIVTELVDHTSIKLFAIGDPHQCIYNFAGTDPKYLIELARRSDMKPAIELERNYRSTQEIIEFSNAILKEDRPHKSDKTGGRCRIIECTRGFNQQVTEICTLVEDYLKKGINPSEIAILHRYRNDRYRERNDLGTIAAGLDSSGIEYTIDKNNFYDRGSIIIRWLEDLGYACLSGWSLPKVGDKETRSSIDDLVNTWMGFGNSEKLGFDKETNHARIYLTEVMWSLSDPLQTLGQWLPKVTDALDILSVFEVYKNEYPDEVQGFHELLNLTMPGNQLSSVPLEKFSNLYPSIRLTTLHSSKGTEFEVVIIAGIERIENSKNGRRLLYVGSTRAKKDLVLIYSKYRPSRNMRFPMDPIYISDVKKSFRSSKWPFYKLVKCL